MGTFHIGADENGLGARLGPLVVTAVLAEVSEQGERTLARKLPKKIRADLDDSKRLVTHTDVSLGEAWARVVTGDAAKTPAELFARLSLEGEPALRTRCPPVASPQCWSVARDRFESSDAERARLAGHLRALEERGVRVLGVQSSLVCTEHLNELRDRGTNRFVADLHAMERLVLSFQKRAGAPVQAICGKVGGIGQ